MSIKITNIRDVAEYQLCCGCGACAYIDPERIRMVDDVRFGRRPVVDEAAANEIHEPQALAVCPGIRLEHSYDRNDPGLIQEMIDAWGPIREIWEGYASDEQIRYAGSSGGAASALALFCIEELGYHGVLHIAARPDAPYLNHTVMSTTRAEILARTGSRYAPASPCDGLRLIEEAPGPCVFIGKPCDVAGALQAAKLRSRLAENLGLTIAIFCAGTPSTKGTLLMLRRMGIYDPTAIVDLRYRGNGWPGRVRVACRDSNGLYTTDMSYEMAWGEILQEHRPWRCCICPDHAGEFADLALGDPWHRPQSSGQPGLSLIVTRTQRGRIMLHAAVASNYLNLIQVSPQCLPTSQPQILHNRGALWGRLQTLRLLGIAIPYYRRIPLFRFWTSELSWIARVKSVFGTVRRTLRRKLWTRRNVEVLSPNMFKGIASGETTERRSLTKLVWRGMRKCENCLWEMRLNISTRGTSIIQAHDAHDYATITYAGINRILQHLKLCSTDVFVDIGCGKGRVVCCAARYPLSVVYGLDISPPLCTVARHNSINMHGRRAPVTIVNTDAGTWDYGTSNILFLFNPFGKETLRKVLLRISKSVQKHRRSIRLVYVNPEFEPSLCEIGWQRIEVWPPCHYVGLDYPVTYWRYNVGNSEPTHVESANTNPVVTTIYQQYDIGTIE